MTVPVRTSRRVLGQLGGRLIGAHRVWETPGGVQIQVTGLGGPGTAAVARDLEGRLRSVPGVAWAEVHGIPGCVFVGWESAATDLDQVTRRIAAGVGIGVTKQSGAVPWDTDVAGMKDASLRLAVPRHGSQTLEMDGSDG
ncbi:hypothetical protein [Streptomyces spinoverrucosus]|nr:hypothetical protein [Streptomyces spinoverrucosus]